MMVVEPVTTEDPWGGVAIMTDLFLILIMMTAGIHTQEIASVSSCWLFRYCTPSRQDGVRKNG